MSRLFYLALCELIFFVALQGSTIQGQDYHGTILDEYQQAIVGAHVFNKNSSGFDFSDDLGHFFIAPASVGDTLLISHLGFEQIELVIQQIAQPSIIELQAAQISLHEVVISPDINALHLLTDINVHIQPVNSSQEVLRQVPGLFIGQHAGGGKAEQIFLRGFDIDHGTDIALTVDGLPINMVSHAHGQGYADLHFIIPETIDNIDFGKGPYYADQGNFNTAGYVDFKTKNTVEHSTIKAELGQFNSQRLLGLINIAQSAKTKSYAAAEYLRSDGPFESPQNFDRFNFFASYQTDLTETDELDVNVSYFTSEWDASGQVPQRAIDSGQITRFGAIDDTEGGNTSRANIQLEHRKQFGNRTSLTNRFFYSYYDFRLFSNFTFFLNDPINGDQIRQEEQRSIYGLNSKLFRELGDDIDGHWTAGLQLRVDDSNDNELARTLNRSTTLNSLQFGDVNELNLGAYVDLTLNFGNWTINPGLRLDYFNFGYTDRLVPSPDLQSSAKSILNPKLNILYNHSSQLQGYLKLGRGFHSNDSRVVVAQQGEEILPAALGVDIGTIWKPNPRLLLNGAFWYLFLEQEFVYVGDEGIVEPSGRTRRLGVDITSRLQLNNWLFWNLDANYTYARSIDSNEGEDLIPLAPIFTIQSGIHVAQDRGIYGGLNLRHLADRPANEDNSIVADGYTVIDFNTGFNFGALDIGVQIQNVLDVEWNETQFATESRLQGESISVDEIHLTPGAPFFIKGVIQYRF